MKAIDDLSKLRSFEAAAPQIYSALKAAIELGRMGEVPVAATLDRWSSYIDKADGGNHEND